jgi:N-ethylmaleimide reductase
MNNKYQTLFEPIKIGSLELKNKIIMAPLTRCRAGVEHIPNDLMAEYYAQRASAGLLIAEATMIMEGNSAFYAEPGIYSEAQVLGWKKVTDAVHAKGGKIFLQIWHGGRACHPLMNNGKENVAPSAIAIEGEVHLPTGKAAHVTPRALLDSEIPTIIKGFKEAAIKAKKAGFDGVEVHGANGYILDEFLRDSANKRTGAYGGSIENRARLLLEVTKEVIEVWGKDRVGVRLSPLNSYNSMIDSNPILLTQYVAKELDKLGIAYLHMMRSDFFGVQKGDVMGAARECFKGNLIGNMGYTAEEANETITRGAMNAVAFGSLFISNPDLVERLKNGYSLAQPNPNTFYTPGPEGYTDYPTYK